MVNSRNMNFTGSACGRRVILSLGCTVVLAVVLGLSPVPARAYSDTEVWTDYVLHASKCEAALNDTFSKGGRCLFGQGLKLMLEQGLGLADAHGKKAFGKHFQVANNLSYLSASSRFGIGGDIDVVLPFSGSARTEATQGTSSFFLQQGLTRSWRESGSGGFRNDLRHGVVRRFRLSGELGADIFGISAFHLFNAEHGHRVWVPGFDYAGRWGIGSFRYYIPNTGWRPGSPGYEERALEGLEVGMHFDLTTTLRLNTVGYRWRAEDGSDRWITAARFDFDWHPHPWLKFGAGYDGIGRSRGSASFRVALRLPFGGPLERAPWEGFGVAAGGSPPASEDLWRPIEDIGPIRVATRRNVSALVDKARVEFLRDSVNSGETIQLEVSLPVAAPEDIRVVVRLVPGNGAHPAVAGEDFVDEPVETTIRKGTTGSIISITLLRNNNMEKPRSLSATVSMAS